MKTANILLILMVAIACLALGAVVQGKQDELVCAREKRDLTQTWIISGDSTHLQDTVTHGER